MDLYRYLLKNTQQFCSQNWVIFNTEINLKDGVYIIPHHNMIIDFPYYNDFDDIIRYIETKRIIKDIIFYINKIDEDFSIKILQYDNGNITNLSEFVDKVSISNNDYFSEDEEWNITKFIDIRICQEREWEEWKSENIWWQWYACNVFIIPNNIDLIRWTETINYHYNDWEYHHYYKSKSFGYDIFNNINYHPPPKPFLPKKQERALHHF